MKEKIERAMPFVPVIFLFLFTGIIASCQTTTGEKSEDDTTKKIVDASKDIEEEFTHVSIQKDTTFYNYSWQSEYNYKSALINNVDVPQGYKRVVANENSYSNWLKHLPISSDNTVYLYNGEKKNNQSTQFKVLDIDVGAKDLQQCADAVMRLRAEYLYSSKQYDKIHFKYTNGVNIPFSKWSSGYYPSLKGNKVVWTSSSNNKSYKSFKKYLINIFTYAGTASLEKGMKNISLSEIQAGDVIIKGGFPGHAVIVLDVVMNERTKDKAFLIAQSYMPAQSIHVLNNPNNKEYSPWYSLNDIESVIRTPEWTFYSNQLKRFIE